MRTEIKEIKVYKFNELSSEAKEVVKQWWLNTLEPSDFERDCLDELKYEYGIETLKVASLWDIVKETVFVCMAKFPPMVLMKVFGIPLHKV